MTMKVQTPSVPGGPVDTRTVPPDMSKMMEQFFGPSGKVTTWVVAADEHHVVLGHRQEVVERTMANIRKGKAGLPADADVAKTTALLPDGAGAVLYVSPAGMTTFVSRTLAATPHLPAVWIPEFPKTPPIGFAETTAPDEAEWHMVVPPEGLTSGDGFEAHECHTHRGISLAAWSTTF